MRLCKRQRKWGGDQIEFNLFCTAYLFSLKLERKMFKCEYLSICYIHRWKFMLFSVAVCIFLVGLFFLVEVYLIWTSLVAQSIKNPPANVRDVGSIPGSRRSPGEGHGNPLQYSCLGNLMDRGARQGAVKSVTKGQKWLSMGGSMEHQMMSEDFPKASLISPGWRQGLRCPYSHV